ncbi:MAG: ABC transporter ATP-binding protein [Gemmataceae bacterium]|nr:ABC transporter ATP-binding protein [Gemmataceae bacterium]
MPMLEFQDIVKDYPSGFLGRHRLRAADGVSFRVEPGEAFGLLGPNRAGKTTLVKLLLSLCRPTSGTVTRLGRPARDRSTLARVGYVHENPAFPRYLSATSLLHYFGSLTLLPEPTVRKRVPELLALTGLADRAHESISRFSKGMVQRLGLAQALLNEPDLLVLDEPNEGLDLVGRQLVRDVVRRQKSRGGSVLFVSHVLTEVEKMCDRVAVLIGGKTQFVGTLDALLRDSAGAARPLEVALKPYYDLQTSPQANSA